ncbi:MAG: hypothetical protein ACRDPY_15200 [Streptosporangiaceae bacterium]
MADDKHQCPRNGCTRRVRHGMLMCRQDWYKVPGPLRGAVWNAWQNGLGAGTPAHRAAVMAAIQAVNRPVTDG